MSTSQPAIFFGNLSRYCKGSFCRGLRVDVFAFNNLHCFSQIFSSLIKIMFAYIFSPSLSLFLYVRVFMILYEQSMFLGLKTSDIVVAVLLKLIDWHAIIRVWSGVTWFSLFFFSSLWNVKPTCDWHSMAFWCMNQSSNCETELLDWMA